MDWAIECNSMAVGVIGDRDLIANRWRPATRGRLNWSNDVSTTLPIGEWVYPATFIAKVYASQISCGRRRATFVEVASSRIMREGRIDGSTSKPHRFVRDLPDIRFGCLNEAPRIALLSKQRAVPLFRLFHDICPTVILAARPLGLSCSWPQCQSVNLAAATQGSV